MSWMIKIEDVSKMYRLGLVGSATIQDDIKRIWHRWRGKEDPFLKIGEENKRDAIGGDYVWALKNINFELPQGEVLGIIGKNGAGKSTLLKLLSKVTKPTTGSITTRGRIASLLEVGTGFHPELTGRENIFLNGAILGMKKHEIRSKFDEIVDFSGCERYIDTPVKRYSSGMYVRLAFAVAAHLDPEILVVDEVLAVGDAEFQKKAIGKMKDVSKGEGRTVLFVSHNMGSINSLCENSIWMENGTIKEIGRSGKVISNYLKGDRENTSTFFKWKENYRPGDNQVKLNSFRFIDKNNIQKEEFKVDEEFGIEMVYEKLSDKCKAGPNFLLSTQSGIKVFQSLEPQTSKIKKGTYKSVCWFPNNFLNDENYQLTIALTTHSPVTIHCSHEIFFDVLESNTTIIRGNYLGEMHGIIRPLLKWETNET
jgi:lipopolysaccharide transport system ATP-binding protein